MARQMSTVVGVFLDDKWAQRAIAALQAAGINARMADEKAVGNLASMGIENSAADLYSSRMNEGGSVVLVDDAGDKGEDALGIMLQNGAENIDLSKNQSAGMASTETTTTSTTSSTGATSGAAMTGGEDHYRRLKTTDKSQRQYGHVDQTKGRARTADEMHVQLREETLSAVKQNEQAGEVQLHKVVHEKQQEIPVTLRHEEVVIERHAVDRPVNPNEIGDMTDQTISVPVYEERAELQKQAHVREEVTIGKRTQEEQQTLSGTTRHEHLEVNQTGNVQVQGGEGMQGGNMGTTQTTQTWSQVMPTYRTRWEQSHKGGNWNEVAPSYEYAYTMRNDPRYQGRSYNEVQSDLQRGWASSKGGAQTAWDKVSSTVRDAWNDLTQR